MLPSMAHADNEFSFDDLSAPYVRTDSGSNVATYAIGALFQPTASGNFNSVSIRIGRAGVPTQPTFTVKIWDSSMSTLISTCDSVSYTSFPDSYPMAAADSTIFPMYKVNCDGAAFTAGTTYLVTLSTPTNFINGGTNNQWGFTTEQYSTSTPPATQTTFSHTGAVFNFSSNHLNFIVNPPSGIQPPTTSDNEVTNYIPSPGVSTTTGTTNVGAAFSIGNFNWINYFGYRIIAPNGTVVYDSSTTPTVNGLYSITTSYNFTQSGVYTGHAYFGTTIGGNNWEVDNPTLQSIAVNTPQWTVNPDGSFTQNPATTSTTTLPNLSLDCGTGFVGSICNLVAKLIVPSTTGIGAIQSSFSAMTQKAPFSFFTQAHTTLQGFQISSSTGSTGGTFALQLYGQSIPIISTTTANGIGIGSTQLSFVKFLIATGLWILFAWFLYWRIASIFGV